MNKILIGISILLGCILVVENLVMGSTAQIIIWYGKTSTMALFAIFIGFIGGYGLKGFLSEKGGNNYDDDEGVNF